MTAVVLTVASTVAVPLNTDPPSVVLPVRMPLFVTAPVTPSSSTSPKAMPLLVKLALPPTGAAVTLAAIVRVPALVGLVSVIVAVPPASSAETLKTLPADRVPSEPLLTSEAEARPSTSTSPRTVPLFVTEAAPPTG